MAVGGVLRESAVWVEPGGRSVRCCRAVLRVSGRRTVETHGVSATAAHRLFAEADSLVDGRRAINVQHSEWGCRVGGCVLLLKWRALAVLLAATPVGLRMMGAHCRLAVRDW